jgi:hypothetical protein
VLKFIVGKIVVEIGLDDGVIALNVSHCFARGQATCGGEADCKTILCPGRAGRSG